MAFYPCSLVVVDLRNSYYIQNTIVAKPARSLSGLFQNRIKSSRYSYTMEASEDRITEKAQSLSDLELAVLICLVADQHCIIEAERQLTHEVVEELKLVGSFLRQGW